MWIMPRGSHSFKFQLNIVYPPKIDSLIEKFFCARPLKDLSIFAGFADLLTQGRAASHPFPPSAESEGGQKFLPPDPFLFARLLKTRKRFFGRRRGLNLGGEWG